MYPYHLVGSVPLTRVLMGKESIIEEEKVFEAQK